MGSGCELEWRAAGELEWHEYRGAGVVAAFPSRRGGVSRPPFDTLNLGLSVGDRPADVLENRRRFCTALGLTPQRLAVPGQVHGTRLAWVDETDAGRGATAAADVLADRDGLLTGTPGLGLVVSYADCVPVVIVAGGHEGPLLATVHAGWRGMIAGVVGQAAAELARRGRLLGAVVGPSICPRCFVVDDVLRARFEATFPGSTGASTVDLWTCARAALQAAGVPASAVLVSGLCTVEDERFYSHRRDCGKTGRHLAVAWRQEG